MGQPITWRNLTNLTMDDAVKPLAYAQQSFDKAFAGFDTALARQEAGAAEMAGLTQEGLKQDFLDKIQAARTPEEAAALEASPEMAALRTRLTAANRNAVRGAEEQRVTQTMQNVLKQREFGDSTLMFENRDEVNAAMMAAALRNDTSGLQKLDARLPNLPEVLTKGLGAGRDQARFKHDQDKMPLELRQMQAALETARAQQANLYASAQRERDTSRSITSALNGQKLEDLQTKALEEKVKAALAGSPYKDGAVDGSPDSMKKLRDGMEAYGLGANQIQDVIENVGKYYGKGIPVEWDDKGKAVKFAPVPVSYLLDKVAQVSGDDVDLLGGLWSRRGDNVVNAMDREFGVGAGTGNRSTSAATVVPHAFLKQLRDAQELKSLYGNSRGRDAASDLTARLVRELTPQTETPRPK